MIVGDILKDNCFAFVSSVMKCGALNETNCNNCHFFKTTQQLTDDENKAIDRFLELNLDDCYSRFKFTHLFYKRRFN